MVNVMRRGAFRFVLSGGLDLGRENELSQWVALYGSSQDTDVHVDLSRVTFIDSTGIAFLIRLRKAAVPRGGTVALLGLNRGCRRVLELVAVPTLFDMQE